MAGRKRVPWVINPILYLVFGAGFGVVMTLIQIFAVVFLGEHQAFPEIQALLLFVKDFSDAVLIATLPMVGMAFTASTKYLGIDTPLDKYVDRLIEEEATSDGS